MNKKLLLRSKNMKSVLLNIRKVEVTLMLIHQLKEAKDHQQVQNHQNKLRKNLQLN